MFPYYSSEDDRRTRPTSYRTYRAEPVSSSLPSAGVLTDAFRNDAAIMWENLAGGMHHHHRDMMPITILRDRAHVRGDNVPSLATVAIRRCPENVRRR